MTLCIWPSGDSKPVVMLHSGYLEVARRLNLEFESGVDDLDCYHGALIHDISIGPIALMEYEHPPHAGVAIYVDSGIDTLLAIEVIKRKLFLSDKDFFWIQSEI